MCVCVFFFHRLCKVLQLDSARSLGKYKDWFVVDGLRCLVSYLLSHPRSRVIRLISYVVPGMYHRPLFYRRV